MRRSKVKAKANMSTLMDLMVVILQRISTMSSNHSKMG